MKHPSATPEVSVIVPARNEEAGLADCLRTLTSQSDVAYEVIVVDDHSTDRTRSIAESFSVRVISAEALPAAWTGKNNAVWAGAKAAKGKWLLFTDADTRHTSDSIAQGLREAIECRAGLLSYSPEQEVHGLAERALMPVIFAELATTFRPQEVSDPNSPAAAANGQYLLIRRDVYNAVGGHATVATKVLEDVELAKLVKRAGYRLQFHLSDAVRTRMYRTFPQMWEGWTKNLALLFPNARGLALRRVIEFALIVLSLAGAIVSAFERDPVVTVINSAAAFLFLFYFFRRIRRAHFDWLSNMLAIFGLPLFTLLLLNSDISHKRGSVRWKGRQYSGLKDAAHDPRSVAPIFSEKPGSDAAPAPLQ